jgi:membrane-associated phospholipid phosphatase
MADSLIGFLRRDLRQALAAGAERSPIESASGAAWLFLWALVAAALGLSLYLLAGYQAGFLQLNAAATSWPNWLWQDLTMLGDERVAFVLALFFARRYPRVFWTLICAALLGAAYSRGLKPLLDAPRPPSVLAADAFQLIGPDLKHESFPSGHSVTAGVFFGVLIYYARRLHWRLLFLLLALLAGMSRVAVGVHWPVDVAAGLAGGALAAWAGAWLARRSPWGIYDGAVHLAFVVVAGIVAAGLWLGDVAYPAATLPVKLLAAAALGYAVLVYLLLPLWRGLRSEPAADSG